MAMTAEKYINEMYDKQKKNTLSQLKTAYDQNVQTIDTAEAEITPQYYEAKRQASGDAAIRRQRLNETFAANGLNTGAVGQAQLALANQENANIAGINRSEADARSAITQQRANLETAYKNNVQQAIAAQDFDRANALYQQWTATRAEAKAQVDAMISAGVMPTADLIAASGYSNDYVSKLYTALRAKGKGGGTTASVTSLMFYPDEGIFQWNGKTYNSVKSLVGAWNDTEMDDDEEATLRQKFESQTGRSLSDYGY